MITKQDMEKHWSAKSSTSKVVDFIEYRNSVREKLRIEFEIDASIYKNEIRTHFDNDLPVNNSVLRVYKKHYLNRSFYE